MRTRALLLVLLALAAGCSDSGPSVTGGQSGSEHTTPTPGAPCPDSGPTSTCCGKSDGGTVCICSHRCSLDTDCVDPGRPRCVAVPTMSSGLCAPAGFECQ
jgi:hypothetical protein